MDAEPPAEEVSLKIIIGRKGSALPGISQATAYRYLREAIEVLAARAPGLREALDRAAAEGLPYLILDGKVVATDRCQEKTTSVKGKEIDRWHSGKAHRFGGNIQALFNPSGVPLWVSPASPGGTHDITAAREHVLPGLRPYLKDLPTLADTGYEGAGCGGFALMTQRWQTLQHVTLSPSKITGIARAALVLVQLEHRMIT